MISKRMFKFNYLTIAKTVFILLLFATIVLGVGISNSLTIDTNLSELNPQNQHSQQTKAAIEQLSNNIERRVILLVQGSDEDQVFDADDTLREQLSKITNIRIHPDNETTANKLINTLKTYRFALLNDQQRNRLQQPDFTDIIAKAKNDVFGFSAVRFYPFNQDPLGWHSDFIQQLFNTLSPPDSTSENYHTTVSFSIEDGAMDMQRQAVLSDALDSITQQLENDYLVNIERSGIFFFAADAASSSKKDISLISTGSTIGVVLLLLLAFRSFWSLILPVSSVLLGVCFAFIVTHYIYGNVHVLTIVFGASLIGIVIDYSLHYFYHVSANSISKESLGNTALYRALLLSLTTSLIGYASLSFSSLQALQKVAVFSCCGLFMAWLSVLCVGEFGTRKRLSLDQTLLPKLEESISNTVAKFSSKVWLLLAVVVASTALLLSVSGNVFSDDPRLFFKASESLLSSEKNVAAVANDYEPGRYVIIQGETNADIYNHSQQLLNLLNQDADFNPKNLTSLVSLVPSIEQQKENYRLQKLIYQEGGIAENVIDQIGGSSTLTTNLVAEYHAANNTFLLPEQIAQLLGESTPPLWINNRTSSSSNDLITSFMLIQKGSNTKTIAKAADQVSGVEFVNTLQRTSDALQQQRFSASQLLLVAYLLIALLLTLRYRSFKTTSMLLVPICASALVIIIGASLGQTLNLFHVMALFLVLGFGMDYTIFTKEIDHMRSITLQAILLSAITSLLSFGLLSISSIPVAQSFGMTLLIGNCFNLLGVFVYSHCIDNNQQNN